MAPRRDRPAPLRTARHRDRGRGRGRSVNGRTLIVAVGVMAILAGLAQTITSALQPQPAAEGAKPTGEAASPAAPDAVASTSGRTEADAQAREALAERPMRQFPASARRPMALTARDPGAPLLLPRSQRVGAAGVASGFPHTPLGAMAQMIAIDQVALQSGSLAGVRAVIGAWAVPGGPTAQSWSGVAAMASLLSGAGLSGAGSSSLSVVLVPAMGLVKGMVGADFVVACVDFEVDVTLAQTVREAAADCERMVWVGDRWMIGPGREPAPGPSVWPDTDEALAVGYRDLRTEPGPDVAAAGEVSHG